MDLICRGIKCKYNVDRFDVSREQLEYLRSLSFHWIDIAALLGISRGTLYRFVILFQWLKLYFMYRRRVEFGMIDSPHTRKSCNH